MTDAKEKQGRQGPGLVFLSFYHYEGIIITVSRIGRLFWDFGMVRKLSVIHLVVVGHFDTIPEMFSQKGSWNTFLLLKIQVNLQYAFSGTFSKTLHATISLAALYMLVKHRHARRRFITWNLG
jgi:hypothetical protein